LQLKLRPFRIWPANELTDWLLPHAIENDRLAHLAELIGADPTRSDGDTSGVSLDRRFTDILFPKSETHATL
jgi:hypothetical protein